ncbi:hypothetical protein BDN72DRAFT_863950 [Pluteus cervinus]|uniref:Uncharacterized protein n=1 Tax=Pluteus cervinus TaxID=181527 RepID=A0ACD3A5L3_9AGAR|nr:hypothetical protein BDN72DRAFT_863950 [Pluteus cervinus]
MTPPDLIIPSLLRYNSQVGINRLPVEIICQLFSLAICESNLDESSVMTLRLTWVCIHWRRIAMGYTKLWTSITIARPECLAHFIALSQKSPLTVALTDIVTADLPFLQILFKCSSRIANLQVHTALENAQLSLWELFDMDQLRPQTHPLSGTLDSLDLDNISFFVGVFPFNPPQQSLKLARCAFTFDYLFQLSPTLTNLDIASPFCPLRHTDVIKQLAHLPAIESITFSDALSRAPDESAIPAQTSLVNLKTLVIRASTPKCMDAAYRFLAHLDLPNIQSVQLWTWTSQECSELIQALLCAAHRSCARFHITYASILASSEESQTQLFVANKSQACNPSIAMRIEKDQDVLFNSMLNGLPLNHVEFLQVGNRSTCIPAARWIEVVGGSKSCLSTLILQNDSIGEFESYLRMVQGHFPRLKKLIFYEDEESSGTPVSLPWKVIRTCKLQTPVSHFVFYGNWDASEGTLNLLKQIGCSFCFKTGYQDYPSH